MLWSGSFLWRGNGTDKTNGAINIISRPRRETLKGWDTDPKQCLSCEREGCQKVFHIQIAVDCTEKQKSLITTAILIEEEIYSVQSASCEKSNWWHIWGKKK